MTFEEFEKATKQDLRRMAKEQFERHHQKFYNEDQAALLLEAQFYMQELDRRESSWIARRDFWLEVVVIFLICIETVLSVYGIALAIKEGRHEDALMDKQNGILISLQTSTSATAAVLKNLNEDVQQRLAALYPDMAPGVFYQPGDKTLVVTNNGVIAFTFWGRKLGDQTSMENVPRTVNAGDIVRLPFAKTYDEISPTISISKSAAVPLVLYLKNDKDIEYELHCSLLFMLSGNNVNVSTQAPTIILRNWSQAL